MEKTEHPSHRLLFIGLGAAVLLVAVIAVVAFVLFGSTKRETNTSAEASPAPTIATKEQVAESLAEVESSMQQAAADQAAAKAALEDSNNEIKVSE